MKNPKTTECCEIKVGDRMIVDSGPTLGTDTGALVRVNGLSVFGFNGVYRSDKDGQKHAFDETVHRIRPCPKPTSEENNEKPQ